MRQDARADLAVGKPVWDASGRKICTLKALSGPEPAGSLYSIVCLGSYPKVGAGCRAVPSELLSYDAARGGFMCQISEMALRSSPSYSGAHDFLDERWRNRLRAHYGRLPAEPEFEAQLMAG
ncbi:MAG: hypothetical protein NVSMB26_06980 [Beijerinckiaceae bacterium]